MLGIAEVINHAILSAVHQDMEESEYKLLSGCIFFCIFFSFLPSKFREVFAIFNINMILGQKSGSSIEYGVHFFCRANTWCLHKEYVDFNASARRFRVK